jgi:hypothetical protein
MKTSQMDAALSYASKRDWYIFPAVVAKKKGHKAAKHSNGRNWGMTKDPAEIRADFQKWPRAGIGIPTGWINRIFVIEADTKKGHGVDGLAALAALEAKHGKLPATLMVMSPSGSVHRYYQHPGEAFKIKNSDGTIAPGVDIRGDGGMVLAPPSVRKDGVYKWLNNKPIAIAPQWLLTMVVLKEEQVRNAAAADDAATADDARIRRALAFIPNPDDNSWTNWSNLGLAIFRATSGSSTGFALFDAWSQRSAKYDASYTEKTWAGFERCPPNRIGAETIFFLAYKHCPQWASWLDAGNPDALAKVAKFMRAAA